MLILLIVLEDACSISFIVTIRIIWENNGKNIKNIISWFIVLEWTFVFWILIVSVAKKNVKIVMKIMLLTKYEAIVNKRWSIYWKDKVKLKSDFLAER